MIFVEQERLQLEQEYILQQQMLSKSASLNEMVIFKKELEKSERQREQLSDHLEVYFIICFHKRTSFKFIYRC